MKINYSKRIGNVKPSAIREILKIVAENPNIVSLATGSPSAEAMPIETIKHISEEIYKKSPIESLQYNFTEGHPALRESTKIRLKNTFNIGRTFDDVIITTGGQQGLDLTPRVLCNEDDTIIVENPSFVSGINAMKATGAKVIGIDMDNEGIELEKLEECIKTKKNVKLLYLIPTFQNPSGKTMSLKRRKAVYDLCLKHSIVILEDNPYGELRFSGEEIPPIKAFDDKGIVVYNGSYSKVISAGMRIGFICAHKEIMKKLIICKQIADCHTNTFFQMVVDQFIRNYALDDHIEKIKSIYRNKCKLMLKLMSEHFNEDIKYIKPEGGLFIWTTLPKDYDSFELARFAAKRGVAFVPGISFMVDDSKTCSSFRLNYSTPSVEDIKYAVPLLGECINDFMNR